ncbi:MAG: hypothetical protein QOJ56_5527 [Mycobacterium sp.]|nr:hypothetical protein [Mycobacterium sp.]
MPACAAVSAARARQRRSSQAGAAPVRRARPGTSGAGGQTIQPFGLPCRRDRRPPLSRDPHGMGCCFPLVMITGNRCRFESYGFRQDLPGHPCNNHRHRFSPTNQHGVAAPSPEGAAARHRLTIGNCPDRTTRAPEWRDQLGPARPNAGYFYPSGGRSTCRVTSVTGNNRPVERGG